MNFFWGKLFWYVLVNFKTHGRRCDGAMTGKWNIRLSSKVKSLDLRFQTTANFGQGLRWPNGLRFWTPNTPNILDIDGHWWTLMDIDGHGRYCWSILDLLGNTSTFCPPSFHAFGCLTTLRHDGFPQSLAHGSDGTVLHWCSELPVEFEVPNLKSELAE